MVDDNEWVSVYEREALIRHAMTPDQRMILDGLWPDDNTPGSGVSEGSAFHPGKRTSPGVAHSLSEPASGSIIEALEKSQGGAIMNDARCGE